MTERYRNKQRFSALSVEVLVPPTVAVKVVLEGSTLTAFRVEWSEPLGDRVVFSRKDGHAIVTVRGDGGDARLDPTDPDVSGDESADGKEMTFTHRRHDAGKCLTVVIAPNARLLIGGFGFVATG